MRKISKFCAFFAFVLAFCLAFGAITACSADDTPDKVSLDVTEKTLFIGETLSLTATPNKPNARLIWSSDDEEVATVSGGLVTAVGEGLALIKVKFGTTKAECLVTVLKMPESISLDVDKKFLIEGESFTLTAITAVEGVNVSWSSADPSVATVNNGVVKAVKEGSTVITAKYGNVSATCDIYVVKEEEPAPAPEYSVSLDVTEKQINVDESFTLKATVSPEGASVIWSSANPSVATVTNGAVKGIAAGTVVITARCGTAKASCLVKVINKDESPKYSVSLNESSKTVTAGESFTLKATVSPAGAGNVTWSTTDSSVATVVNGTVKAINAGTAIITATYFTVSATCKVTVNKNPDPPEPEYSVSLDYNSKTMETGESFTLKATVSPAGSAVTWSSSDKTVATVTDGTVKALKAGTAAITAKCGTATAVCAITVNEKQVEGDVYELVFGGKADTCNNPGTWYFMCDGYNSGGCEFASTPKYDNGTVTLAFNSVSGDTSKHFQLRIQPEFAIGTEYTVKFTVKLSAAGQVVYGLSNKNTNEKFAANESKQITAQCTVTSGEPFIIEVLPAVRSAPVTMTVSDVEFTSNAVPEPTTLKDKYTDYFPIGAAVQNSSFTGYSEQMENFNSVTPENDMKWKFLEPSEGKYSWTNADNIVKWAKANGAGVRGHCLVWYKSLPDWLSAKITDKTAALEYLNNHIETVMNHFGTGAAKDVIYVWDVCNEVLRNSVSASQLASGNIWRSVSTDGSAFGSGTVDWYTLCGTDFIKQAFRKADEMRTKLGLDNVKLYYNDYSLNDPNKRAACVQLVQMLKDEGIAIDGVGMQAHYRLSSYEGKEDTFLKNFEDSIKAFTGLGIDVQITELDIRVYANDSDAEKEITPEIFAKQGEMYGKILEICRKYATPHTSGAGRVTCVTTWGVSDKSSAAWDTASHKEYPFIFDENKQPKKAFEEMMNF